MKHSLPVFFLDFACHYITDHCLLLLAQIVKYVGLYGETTDAVQLFGDYPRAI